MPRLLVENGHLIGSDFSVLGNTILGRKKSCSAHIPDVKASRKHARIFQKEGKYYIEDMGSSNGTYLNEVKITTSPLTFRDRIRIGDTVLLFIADPAEGLEGRRLGGFAIEEKLGERDTGIVYRARQVTLDRTVALKILSPDLSNDREFVDRFIAEARNAGTLRHPNIIHIFDVGKTDSYYYISMEYVSGKTLRNTMKEARALTLQDMVRIIRDCAEGLAFAHSHNIVHKEITPANIILTEDKRAKIANMGIGRLTDEPISSRNIYSLYYISPEEALGEEPAPHCDMYSLGLCLFEMLTGKLPFRSTSAIELIKEHTRSPVPSPVVYEPDIPEGLAKIVTQMCALQSQDRFPHMKEVAAQLEVVNLGRAHSARPGHKRRIKQRNAVAQLTGADPQPERVVRVKYKVLKKGGLFTGTVGLLLFLVILVMLFFISSYIAQLILNIIEKE